MGVQRGGRIGNDMNTCAKIIVPIMLGVMGVQAVMGEETAPGDKEQGGEKEQQKETVSAPARRVLVIQLDQQNEIVLAVASIVSISKHTFMLNGTMPVWEVTIDTTGNNSVRFYCVEEDDGNGILMTNDPQEATRKAAGRVAKEIMSSGRKNSGKGMIPSVKFPEGVYAHTIEYQVGDPAALEKLYSESEAVWEANAPKIIRIKLNSK